MTKRLDRMGWTEMRLELPLGIVAGLIAGLWTITVDGTPWEALGMLLVVATIFEWLGSILFRRTHQLTQEDIYTQMLSLREKIRRFDDDEQ